MRRIWQSEEGMTLIELMAAVVVTTVVVAAALTIVVSSNKATQVNEQVGEVQQNVRLAMDLIAQDIKLAGFNMTSAVGACTVGPLNLAAPIVPGDNAPAGADAGPDSVRLVVPAITAGVGGATPMLSAMASGASNIIFLSAGDIASMGTAGLTLGSVVSVGGSFSSPVVAVGATSLTLAKSSAPSAQFPIGTPVYLLQCVQYSISANPVVCGGSTSCLLRNGVPMVDGIEDLQLAYACDGCNVLAPNTPLPNGVIDDQDAPVGTPVGAGVFNAADFITNNTWAVSPMLPDKIKLVQVTIVARDNQQSKGLGEVTSVGMNTAGPVIVSDHNPSADAGYNLTTYQQQRRRVLTRTIQVRNLES